MGKETNLQNDIATLVNDILSQEFPDLDTKSKKVLTIILERILKHIMYWERDNYLEKQPEDKGNGSYERYLQTALGILELSVPRTRTGEFRPKVIPEKYKRFDNSYIDLLESLLTSEFSQSAIKEALKKMGLSYSDEELDNLVEGLKERVREFKERELPKEALALIIDAYHTEIRDGGRVKKAVCYIVVGIERRKGHIRYVRILWK